MLIAIREVMSKKHEARRYTRNGLPIIARNQLDAWMDRAEQLLKRIEKDELDPYEACDFAHDMCEEFSAIGCFYVEQRNSRGFVTLLYVDDLEQRYQYLYRRLEKTPEPDIDEQEPIEITAEMVRRLREKYPINPPRVLFSAQPHENCTASKIRLWMPSDFGRD